MVRRVRVYRRRWVTEAAATEVTTGHAGALYARDRLCRRHNEVMASFTGHMAIKRPVTKTCHLR